MFVLAIGNVLVACGGSGASSDAGGDADVQGGGGASAGSGGISGRAGSGGNSGASGASGSGGASGGPGSDGGAGVGGMTAVSRCDINNFGTQECIEYSPGYVDPAPGCATLHGTYSTGPCDLSNSSGGCKQVFGSGTTTSYYYSPTVTADAVMVTCTDDGNATYVAP
jgi:hypothetical protein